MVFSKNSYIFFANLEVFRNSVLSKKSLPVAQDQYQRKPYLALIKRKSHTLPRIVPNIRIFEKHSNIPLDYFSPT